jgi:DNA-binding CsgD family transcriptional regulator
MSGEGDGSEALIDAIYDGVVEMPGWRTFLAQACATLGGEAASILIESNSLGYPEHLRFFSANAPPQLREEIERFSAEVIFPGADGINLHPRCLSISARIAPGIAFAFSLWGQTFGEGDRVRVQAVAPHLMRAMRIFVRYAQAYRERAVYQTVVDRIGVGVALVDAKSAMMASNTIAGEILGGPNGLGVTQGRLVAHRPPVANVLARQVRAAAEAQTSAPSEPGRPLAIERNNNPSPLTLTVYPGPGVEHGDAPLRRSAIVVMRDPDRRAAVSTHVVAQLFSLTPAEAALATLLAQGYDMEEAASTLGVRRNTARSQLQSIFAKTDAKRQSELVRMILSSVATLSN